MNVISTQGASAVRDNVVTVFGSRTVEGLDAFKTSLSDQSKACAVGYTPPQCLTHTIAGPQVPVK